MPTVGRPYGLHFSIVQQIDGLAYKCQGRGARIERDVFAPTPAEAVCDVHGIEPWMSATEFCGFYFADLDCMPNVVATVATHRGYGIFVVPVLPASPPLLHVPRTVKGADGVRRAGHRRHGWYEYLMSHARLVFNLPADAFFDTSTGAARRFPHKVQAVLAQFGTSGQFKSVPRRERSFDLKRVRELDTDGPKLGVRPFLSHMVSPLAAESIPTRADDVAPASNRPPSPSQRARHHRAHCPAAGPQCWLSWAGWRRHTRVGRWRAWLWRCSRREWTHTRAPSTRRSPSQKIAAARRQTQRQRSERPL